MNDVIWRLGHCLEKLQKTWLNIQLKKWKVRKFLVTRKFKSSDERCEYKYEYLTNINDDSVLKKWSIMYELEWILFLSWDTSIGIKSTVKRSDVSKELRARFVFLLHKQFLPHLAKLPYLYNPWKLKSHSPQKHIYITPA